MKYDYLTIEKKWQDRWADAGVFRALDEKQAAGKPKFYALLEFPYPSGAGMHVGHIKAYSSLEVISRMRRMQGVHKPLPALREDNSIERKILSALRQRALTGCPRACILTCNALQ